MKARNAATGEVVDVSTEEAASLYASGQWQLEKGATLPVRSVHGNLTAVAPEQLTSAMAEGATLASEQEWTRADREARYGTPGQVALTGVEGVGSGLTLGAYGAIADVVDPEYAQEYAARQQVNPIASTAGEVVGAVAPLVVSGGTSAVARGATALPRLAMRGGLAAEAATARALGAGTTALGRIGRSAAAKAIGGAVETLPYAIGRGVSTAALDDDASAERILAQIGIETIAGGLAGGILGGGGRAVREGYDAAAKRVFGDATHPGLGETMVRVSAALSGEDAGTIRRLTTGEAGEGVLSTSARKNRADAFFDGDRIRAEAARDLSDGLDDARRAIDSIQSSAPPTQEAVAAQIKLDAATRRLDDATNLVRDPEAAARHIDALMDPKDSSHAAIRAWVDAADVAAKASGKTSPEVAKLSAVLDRVDDRVVLANQARALTQSVQADSGAGGLALAASFAFDSLAPLGGAAVIGGARKALRAAQTPGAALRKLASIERLVEQATKRIDTGAGTYIRSLGGKAAKAVAPVSRAAMRSAYDRTRERLDAAETSPDARNASVRRSMAPGGSERATEAMAGRVSAADDFLRSKMPSTASSNPWRKREPSDSDVAKVGRYIAATEDPIGTVTTELETGRLSVETMETLRTLYPSIAEQVTTRVLDGLAERDTAPAYGELVRLSLLLGTPLDPSLDPARVAQLQDSYQWSDQGQAPTKRKRPSRGMSDVADSYQTTMDRLKV